MKDNLGLILLGLLVLLVLSKRSTPVGNTELWEAETPRGGIWRVRVTREVHG